MGIYDSLQNGNQNQAMQQALQSIKSNPGNVLSQAGYNVPENIRSNPQAIIQHLVQTNQIPAARLQRFAPFLQRMGIR